MMFDLRRCIAISGRFPCQLLLVLFLCGSLPTGSTYLTMIAVFLPSGVSHGACQDDQQQKRLVFWLRGPMGSPFRPRVLFQDSPSTTLGRMIFQLFSLFFHVCQKAASQHLAQFVFFRDARWPELQLWIQFNYIKASVFILFLFFDPQKWKEGRLLMARPGEKSVAWLLLFFYQLTHFVRFLIHFIQFFGIKFGRISNLRSGDAWSINMDPLSKKIVL